MTFPFDEDPTHSVGLENIIYMDNSLNMYGIELRLVGGFYLFNQVCLLIPFPSSLKYRLVEENRILNFKCWYWTLSLALLSGKLDLNYLVLAS